MDAFNYSTSTRPNSPGVLIFVAICIPVLSVVSIVGNSFVIFVILANQRLRSSVTNVYTIQLAISDVAVGIFVMPLSAYASQLPTWPLPRFLCEFLFMVYFSQLVVTVVTIMLISVDRFILVRCVYHYKAHLRATMCVVFIGFAWVQGLAFSVPPVLIGWVAYDVEELVCSVNWHDTQDQRRISLYVIVAFTCCYILPVAVILFCYLATCSKLRFGSRRTGTTRQRSISRFNSGSIHGGERHAREIFVSIVIVFVAFIITQTPFAVTKVMKHFGSKNTIPSWISAIATVMQFASCCVNPFIYGILRKDIANAFRKLFVRRVTW